MHNLADILKNSSDDTRALNHGLFAKKSQHGGRLQTIPVIKSENQPATTEDDMQIALFQWIDSNAHYWPGLEYAFHTPNGGYRAKATAVRMKRMGLRDGVPDVLMPYPTSEYSGLALELKVKRNKPTEKQTLWLMRYKAVGYYVAVVYDDWQIAAGIMVKYLRGLAL